ncbi:MAG: DsrE/DsrF/DrsH-like family protein [Rhodospirillales bacterium]|nr:DsrE/DsrF/DrsH-like family protein [Rhodospirillales bacterium]
MAADAPAAGRLSLIVMSGEFVRVHYALVLASAALAVGRPVTLFFTLDAARALTSADAYNPPGWARLPAAGGQSPADIDAGYRARGVAGFEDLLAACIELGARIIVCEMALVALGLPATALRTEVKAEIAGVVTLLAETETAPLVI